jgi:mono/diheme cytochrome c family protein
MPRFDFFLWASTFCLVAVMSAAVVAQRSTADKTRPSLLTPSLVGRDNFTSYCSPCHGREGTGNGPVASALKTSPPDLTTVARRAGGTFPRQRIEAFITSGGSNVPAHGSREMPVWGPTFLALGPPDKLDKLVKIRIANLVSYVESIQVK